VVSNQTFNQSNQSDWRRVRVLDFSFRKLHELHLRRSQDGCIETVYHGRLHRVKTGTWPTTCSYRSSENAFN